MNIDIEFSETTKRLFALEALKGENKKETTPAERPIKTFSWLRKDLQEKYSSNLRTLPEKASSTSIASRKLLFDGPSTSRDVEVQQSLSNESSRAFRPSNESKYLMTLQSKKPSENLRSSTSNYTRSEFYGLAGSATKYQGEIPRQNFPVVTKSCTRIPLAQNNSRSEHQSLNQNVPMRSESNLNIPTYTQVYEPAEKTFLAPSIYNQPQSSRSEDANRFLVPSTVLNIPQQNRYENRTAPYYSTKWTRPIIPDYIPASPTVNDQTYTIGSSFDISMRKSNEDFDDLFTTKGSIEFQDPIQFTSGNFIMKNNPMDSFLFSPPPEKKAKVADDLMMSDFSEISDSLLEQPPSEIRDKKNKISTELLFGDASIDSEKIFSQSDVNDDMPMDISANSSDIVDLVSMEEKSYDKIIEAKTKKPIESDSSFSSESNVSINSTYFDKIFEGKTKEKNESKGAVKKVPQPTRFSARKRNTQVPPTQSDTTKEAKSRKNNLSMPAQLVNEDIENQEKSPALSEPIIKPAKLSAATTSASEPIEQSLKENALEKLNDIFKRLKERRNEPWETVDTYYNSKERKTLLESKVKPKFISQPVVLGDGIPDFENVKEYFRQKREILKERYCHIEIGSKNQIIKKPLENQDSFDYGEINESLQEIEESFNNPLSFLTSTPERSIEIKAEPIEIDSNYPVSTIEDSQPPPSPHFSQLTHISASLPFDAIDPNYEFALNSVLNITEKNQTPQEDRMDESNRIDFIYSLIHEENILENSFVPDYANKEIVERRRAAIMTHIEGIIQTLLKTLVEQKPIVLKICKVKDFKDCTMAGDILSKKETAIALKKISFTNANTARTYTIMVFLICEIYKMISKGVSVTRRELYYRDPALMLNQTTVNRAVEDVCILLNVLPWEVGVLSTSKGLVAGDLKIYMAHQDIIDCSQITRSVPQVPTEISKVTSDADYILVVEKDTVFTRLVQDKIFSKLKNKIILITGKGYPDINTRVLLKRLEADLKLPIYIVVDADPHGIEIMCTYKFGSLQMIHNSEQLAVKSIEWLGLYPSDIKPIDVPHMNLTAAELKKVDELLDRPYLTPKLLQELHCFKTLKLKAEIEGLYETSTDYFIRDYLSTKILGIPQPFIDGLVKAGNQWYKTGKDSYINSNTQAD